MSRRLRILFLCAGNSAWSRLAEVILRWRTASSLELVCGSPLPDISRRGRGDEVIDLAKTNPFAR
jgi:hypothetical protein